MLQEHVAGRELAERDDDTERVESTCSWFIGADVRRPPTGAQVRVHRDPARSALAHATVTPVEACRVGRALAMEPKLLLLDEPVAGMNLEEPRTCAYLVEVSRVGAGDDHR